MTVLPWVPREVVDGAQVVARETAQEESGYSVLGNIQDQAGLGSDQPDRAIGFPLHGKGVGLDYL